MVKRKDNTGRGKLTGEILKLVSDIFQACRISVPLEWMSSDLTVAQLRVMLVLYTEGQRRMSAIATAIGITVSTATGVVDNLVKKQLVLRESDPEDRRLVICLLSPQGEELVNRLWVLGRSQVKKLLDGLSMEDLQKAAEVALLLMKSAAGQNDPAAASR